MTQIARPSEGELTAFAENLRQLRSTLSPAQQHLLDAVLLTAAGEDAAVQGYGLDGTAAKRAAIMAVVALGLTVGGMSSPGAGTAHASEMSQGGGHGGSHGSGPQSTSQGFSQQGSGQQGSGSQGSGSGNRQGNNFQSGNQHSGNQGGNQHSGNQGGNQWSRTNQGGNHWSRVPSGFQHYYGPRYTYSQDWYFYRHISFPEQYRVVYEEPGENEYAEYYFYDGAFYCFIG